MATARALTFADLLRRHRYTAGLSQDELAERAGLSRSGISELERGLKRAPRKDTIARLADALQLAGAVRAAFEAAARGRSAEGAASTRRLAGSDRSAAGVTPSVRPALPHLVGRAHELARLDAFLAHDGPRLLLLAGEPGIGKSRLLREIAARARAAGWAVLEGGCQRRGGQPPFAPLLEALAAHLARRTPAQLRADLAGAAWLARLLPELAEAAVVPAPHWALPPEQERRLMFDAVARFLANAAGPSGTLLILDDLQWAGTDAFDLLGSLAALARSEFDLPLRILGAYRSTETPAGHLLPHLLADLARDGLAAELPLAPLVSSDARALLDDLLVDAGGRAGLTDRLMERAGGVPFYLVSCARAALAALERATEFGEETVPDDAVPWDAAQSIRQRIALLPAAAANLVRVAAVAGRQVDRATLEALAGWLGLDARATAQALESALHARLLLEEGDAAYRFAHDLIREVASAEIGAWRRRAAHRVSAEALEAHLPEREREQRAAELAQHFAGGGEVERALPYLERAGARAQAQYANAEAERIYRELLRHYEALGHPLDAARAAERLGRVFNTVSRHDEASAILTQAARIYQEADDTDGYARAMATVGRAHSTNGKVDVGIDLLEAVANSLDPATPSHGAIAVHTVRTMLYWTATRYVDQAAAAAQASDVARALHDDHQVAWAESLRWLALLMLGQLQESIPQIEAALPAIEERGDADTLGWFLVHLGEACACVGRLEPFMRHLERARELATQMGNPISMGYAWYWLGLHAIYVGDWQRAHECFEKGRRVASEVEISAVRGVAAGYPLLGLGLLCFAQGQDELGATYLEEALAFARLGLPPRLLRPVQGCLAERAILAARPDEALERLDPILATPEGREGIDATPLLPLLAWAHLEAGNLSRAEETIRKSLDRCRAEHHQLALLDALRVQALLAIRCKRWGEATAALDEALALAHPMPYPYAEAKALAVYGDLHAAKGEPEQARTRYQAALAILGRLGERLYGARIARALAELAEP